jgi:hypothetical protein
MTQRTKGLIYAARGRRFLWPRLAQSAGEPMSAVREGEAARFASPGTRAGSLAIGRQVDSAVTVSANYPLIGVWHGSLNRLENTVY